MAEQGLKPLPAALSLRGTASKPSDSSELRSANPLPMTSLARLRLAALALTALALPAASSFAQSGAAYTVVESGRQFSR